MEENKYDELIRLQKLKENGTLTEKEFENEKNRILCSSDNLKSNNNEENKKNMKEQNFTKARPLNVGSKLVMILKYSIIGFIFGMVNPLGRRLFFSKRDRLVHRSYYMCNIYFNC